MRTPTPRSRLRRGLCAALIGLAPLAPRLAGQLPTGPTVVAGSASVSSGPNSATVTAGNNSVLKWASFNVGAGNLVQFVQPSSTARVLNWIGGLSPAQINGTVKGNGEVYLVDAAGIYFGKTAVVDFGSFYAVGGALSKDDFLQGFNRFTSLTGDVRNAGTIEGATVALVGRSVANTGTIVSPGGYVALGAGNEVILGHDGSDITVDAGTATAGVATGVSNTGTIDAGGGTAVLAAGDLYAVAIAAGGQLRAHHVALEGNGGAVQVSGTIDASTTRPGSKGGTVVITGGSVDVQSGAAVTAAGPAGGGTILVGGDTHGANAAVPDATTTTVASGVTLDASATAAGDGGRVVVWSNQDTEYSGAITARGGPAGGNGGSAEVSGGHLGFFGTVDLLAPAGSRGTLLLDPLDLTINDSAPPNTAVTAVPPYSPTASGSVLTWTSILGILGTANLTVTTSGTTGAAQGNITIAESPNQEGNSGAYNATFGLTLTAANNILVNASVVNAGTGNLTLNAGGSIALGASLGTAGTLTLNPTTGVTQSAGTVSGSALVLQGSGDVGSTGTPLVTSLSNMVTGYGVLNASLTSGNVYVSQTGAVGVEGTTAGNLTVNSTGVVSNPATLSVAGTTTIQAPGEPITLTTATNVFTGAVSLSGSNVAVADSTALLLGPITATGTLGLTAGGTVSQVAAPTAGISAPGGVTTVTVTAAGDIDLSNTGNTFGANAVAFGGSLTNIKDVTLVNASPTAVEPTFTGLTSLVNVTLQNTATGLAVPALGLSGNLAVAADGPITQAGALSVGGTSSFTATGQTITLTNSANALSGAVSVTGSNVALVDASALVLGPTTATGTLNLTSGGTLSQSGSITATGGVTTVSLTASGDVDLANTGNNFGSNAVAFAGTLSHIADLTLVNASPTAVEPSLVGLTLANVTLQNTATGLAVPALDISGSLTVTAAGPITEAGILTVGGPSEFSAGANAITLTLANAFTGKISLDNSGANAVSLVNGGATILGLLSVGSGLLTVTSLTGEISQEGEVIAQGPSSFNAGANPIDLNSTGNTFQGAVSLNNSGANNVVLANHTATILAASAVGTGTLEVTSNGAISQTGAVAQAPLAGTATFTAGANAITLTNAGNDFTGAVVLGNSGANNVALTNSGPLEVGASTVGSGTLGLQSGGALTQSGAITQAAGAGAATLNAGAGAITLTNTGNDFTGSVLLTAGAGGADLTNSGATILGTSSVGLGGLTVSSGGAITQTGAVTNGGPSSFNAGANPITLTAANALTGAVTLTNSGANNVALANVGPTSLAASSVGSGTLTVTSTSGAITQTGAITQATGAGTATFNAGTNPITLTNAGNGFTGAVSVTGSNVALANGAPLAIASASASGSLQLFAQGDLTQTGTITDTAGVTTLGVTVAGSAITLGNTGNNFGASTPVFGGVPADIQSLTLASANAGAVLPSFTGLTGLTSVAIDFPNAAIAVPALSLGGSLSLTAGGAITQTGVITQTSTTALTSFNAGAHAITLSLDNAISGPVSLNNSGANNIVFDNGAATNLAASSVGTGTLNVTSAGAITETGAVTQAAGAGAATFNAGANPITLTQANGFTGAVSLENSGSGAVALSNAGALVLGASSLGTGTLTVTSSGAITESGAVTQATGAGPASFNANSNAITLTDTGNTFTGSVSLNNTGANAVSLTNSGNTALGTSSVGSGALSVTSTSGAITESGAVTQAAGATSASFNAGAFPIILTAANVFTGPVQLTTTSFATVDDLNGLILGSSNVGQELTLTSGGSITQTGAITATGGTSLTLTAAGSSVSLGNANNNFGTSNPVITAGSLLNVVSLALGNENAGATVPVLSSLTNLSGLTLDFPNAAIALPTLALAGNLNVTAGGAVTQAGPAVVVGTTSIAAGANPITLTNPANSFTGAVSLSNSGANAVALAATGATLHLGNLAVGTGTLSVSSTGSIVQQPGTTLVQAAGAGVASFEAQSTAIDLDNTGNELTGAVEFFAPGGVTVNFVNGGPTNLGASTFGTGNVTIDSAGALTQSGPLNQSAGGGTFALQASGGITLTNGGNAFTGPVTLADAADAVALDNGGPLELSGAAASLQVTAAGAITEGGGGLTVPGLSSFHAGSADITLTNAANSFTGAVSASGANVGIRTSGGLVVGTVGASGDLALTAGGNLSQTGVITATGGPTTITVTQPNAQIQLTNAQNQFGSAPPSFVGGADIIDLGFANASPSALLPSLASLTSLQGLTLDFPNSAIALPTLSLSGNLIVLAGGSITQQVAATIVVQGTSSFQGAGGVSLGGANQLAGAVSLGAGGSNGVMVSNVLATNLGATGLGSGGLTIDSGGTITQSAPLSTGGPATFTSTGGNITLTNPSNAMAGSIALNTSGAGSVALTNGGTGTILGSSTLGSGTLTVMTTTGGITQTAPITASGNASFTAGTGSIVLTQANAFTGTVALNTTGTGGASLTNTAATTTLAASNVGSGTLAVVASGAIGQSGVLTVAGPSSFSGGNTVTLTNPANAFSGPVSLTTTAGDADLAGAGTVPVGASSVFGNLTVTGGSAVGLSGSITTGGTQSFDSAVSLQGNTTLTGTTLSLASTLAGNGYDLTLNFSGGQTINGAIMTGIGNLTTGGASTVLEGAITTQGNQTYNSPTSLSGNTTLSGIGLSFVGTLNGNGYDLTLEFASAGALSGDSFTDVGNLTTGGGPSTLSGDLTASGNLTFGNAITLIGNTVITTSGASVTFDGTISSPGGYNLTILSGGGSPTFRGPIGAGGALGTLTLTNSSPGGVALTAITATNLDVTTAGPVTNSGGLVISGEAKINAGNNPITLGTTTNTSIGSLDLTGSVVTVDQAAGVLHIVDANAGSLTLTNTGGGVQLDSATVGTGSESGTGALTINANGSVGFGVSGLPPISAQSLDVEAHGIVNEAVPIQVSGASTINANGYDVSLGSTGNNFNTLSVTGAAVTINDSNQLEIQKIAASGSLTVDSNGPLTVGRSVSGVANITLISNDGGITFLTPDSTPTILTAAGNLTLQSAQGVTFGANTGLKADGDLSLTSVGSLTMNAASSLAGGTSLTIKSGGDAVLGTISTTSGPIAVTAAGAAEFLNPTNLVGATSVTAGAGGVKFDGTLNGSATAALTVTTPGTTTFTGAVGGTSAPGTIQTEGGGPVLAAGGSLTAATELAFSGPVTAGGDTTFTAPTLTFGGTLDAGAGGSSVTISSAAASFTGSIGSVTPLTTFTVGGGSITFGAAAATNGVKGGLNANAATGGSVTTTGAQTYTSGLVLEEDTTLTSSGGATLTLGGGANGGFALTLATAGTAQINSALGSTTPLGSLTAGTTTFNAAGTTAVPTVATTGLQTYTGAVTLQQATVLTSSGAAGGITLDGAVAGTGFALALNAPLATVSAAGDLGSSSGRLASVSTDGGNVVIGADIWAQGDIDLGLGSASSATGNSYLAFNSSQTAGNTRIDSATGTITLGSGTGGSAAKTAAPLAASIYKSNPGDLYLFGASVVVEPYERVAVADGSLVAIADGTAAGDGVTLSSTAVADYLVISTANQAGPSILIRSRPPANVLGTSSDSTSPDQGTDLLAGAVLFFNARFGAIPTRSLYAPESSAGSAYFDYAAETGNVLSSGGNLVLSVLPESGGSAVNVYVADLLSKNDFRPTIPNLVYLDLSTAPGFTGFQNGFISPASFGPVTNVPLRDLVATGAETRNSLEQAFTPDVPLEEEQAPAVDADIAEGIREQLQALGIYARQLLPDEVASRQRHAGLFVNIPPKVHPRLADYQVADARVEDRAVRDVITLAVKIGLLGGNQQKLDAVAKALSSSFNAFSADNPQGDPNQYRRWLAGRTDADSQRVAVFMDGLREVMRRVSLLGLTDKELEGAKAQIYGSILSPRLYVDAEFLRTLVEGLQSPPPLALSAPGRNSSSVQASIP